MKTKLFFVPVILAVFISIFAANGTPTSSMNPELTCCQVIRLVGLEGVLVDCEVCVYTNTSPPVLVDCETTDSNGEVTICGLTQGNSYIVNSECCEFIEGIPTFQACEIAVVEIPCP